MRWGHGNNMNLDNKTFNLQKIDSKNKQNRFLSVFFKHKRITFMTFKDDQLIKILWGCVSLEKRFEHSPYSVASRDLETLRLYERFKSNLLERYS